MKRLLEALLAAALGAALAVFCIVLGLPGIVSIWADAGPIVVVFTAASALLGAALGPPRGRLVLFAALVAIEVLGVFVTLTPVSMWLSRGLIRADERVEPADAIYVFGSALDINDELDGPGAMRLMHGLELLALGRSRQLVLAELESPASRYSDAARRLMRRLGSRHEFTTIGPVHNSHDEAVAVARLFHDKGWRRVLAVTSPLHSRRACAALEHEGLSVICSPALEPRYDLARLADIDDRVRVFGAALHERLGLWAYARRGWL